LGERAEQQADLQHADTADVVSLHVTATAAESREILRACWRHSGSRPRRQQHLVGYVVINVGLLVTWTYWSSLGPVPLLAACGVALVLVNDHVASWIVRRKQRRRNPHFLDPIDLVVDGAGLTWSQRGEQHSYPWPRLRLVDTQLLVLFLIDGGRGGTIALPKRLLTEAQLATCTRFAGAAGDQEL
jgi:hypothetical protein